MTDTRTRILDFTRAFIAEYGRSPTHNQIAANVGCTRQNVTRMLAAMQRDGLVTIDQSRPHFPGRNIAIEETR